MILQRVISTRVEQHPNDLRRAIIRSPSESRAAVARGRIDTDAVREECACDGGASVSGGPMQRGSVETAVGDDETGGVCGVEEQWDEEFAVEGRAVDV